MVAALALSLLRLYITSFDALLLNAFRLFKDLSMLQLWRDGIKTMASVYFSSFIQALFNISIADSPLTKKKQKHSCFSLSAEENCLFFCCEESILNGHRMPIKNRWPGCLLYCIQKSQIRHLHRVNGLTWKYTDQVITGLVLLLSCCKK